MDTQQELIIKRFYGIIKNSYAEKTVKEYARIASQLLESSIDDPMEIKSEGKFRQVRAVIKKMQEENLLKTDAFFYGVPQKWKRQKLNVREKHITDEKFRKLLEILPTRGKGKQIKRAVELSYFCGLRIGETLKLQPYHFEARKVGKDTVYYLNLTADITKRKKARSIVIEKPYSYLAKRFKPFTISVSYVEHEFKKVIRIVTENPETRLSFHCLRHSYATNHSSDLRLLQQQLGHERIETTAIYDHAKIDTPERLKAAGYKI